MSLLNNNHYPAVRAALDTSLSESKLPDSVISLSIYAPAAELDVLARDPDAEGRTGDELERVTNAAIYFCAARLAPALPQLLATSDEHNEWRWQARDWQARARELRQLADENLNAVLEGGEVVRPAVFAVASGRRG